MSTHPAQSSRTTRAGNSNHPPTPRRNRAAHRPVRAFRCSDREQVVGERTALLGLFLSNPADIARALREVRKAAMNQALHYDPARHAALLRLARTRSGAVENRKGGQSG